MTELVQALPSGPEGVVDPVAAAVVDVVVGVPEFELPQALRAAAKTTTIDTRKSLRMSFTSLTWGSPPTQGPGQQGPGQPSARSSA
jgi:hypothetical protein